MIRRGAISLFVALFVACGGSASPVERTAARRSDQARRMAHTAGLSPAVEDFVATYFAAVAKTFSVTYHSDDPNTPEITVSQRPPERRVDLRGTAVERSDFQLGTGAYSCVRSSGEWTCRRASTTDPVPGLLSPTDVERTVQALQAQRAGYTLRIGKRKLAGATATCLVAEPKQAVPAAAADALCLSPQGAVLLRERPGDVLRAIRYSTHVDRKRLRLPAPPRRNP